MSIFEEINQNEQQDQDSVIQGQLTSLADAVAVQNEQIQTLTDSMKTQNRFLEKTGDQLLGTEETPGQLEQVLSQLSGLSRRFDSAINEIRTNSSHGSLSESQNVALLQRIAEATAGEDIKNALTNLTAATKAMTTTWTSISEQAATRDAIERRLLVDLRTAAASFHGAGKEELSAARNEAATAIRELQTAAVSQITERVTDANAKGDRVLANIESMRKLIDSRKVWSAIAACFLTLLPVAVIVLGVFGSISALIYGWDFVVATDAELWPRIGRGFLAALATAGAVWALFLLVRWVAGLVGSWSTSGVPRWPRWNP